MGFAGHPLEELKTKIDLLCVDFLVSCLHVLPRSIFLCPPIGSFQFFYCFWSKGFFLTTRYLGGLDTQTETRRF